MKRNKHSNVLWGIILIIVAVVLVLSQLGLLGTLRPSIWTLLLTAIFLVSLVHSIVDFDLTGIIFSIAFLLVIYDKYLGITALSPWTILIAAGLLSIGLSLLFPKRIGDSKHADYSDFRSTIEHSDGDTVDCVSRFGSCIKYVQSQNLTRCNIVSRFAGCKLYFDTANIQEEYAELRVSCDFGGIELYIPKEWTITNQAHVFLGGIDEKNPTAHVGGGSKVILTGTVRFGGVEIIYV